MHNQFRSIGSWTCSLALLPTLLLPNFAPAAQALGCVNLDLGNQIKITGSKDAPGVQQNQVDQAIGANCVGNTNVHHTTQLYVGADGANQTRNSSQLSEGLSQNLLLPAAVINAGNVNIQVGTATSIYNPALDPNFLPKK